MCRRQPLTLRARSTALLLSALALAGATVSYAGTVSCSVGAGCLNATDSFNWATNFGAEFNSIPNGSTAVSDSGLFTTGITFAGGGDGQRMDQGSGWNGNFEPGAALLWTNSPGQGPLTLTFSEPLTAAGFQIQGDFLGPFTVGLLAFDSQGNRVGSAFLTGNSNSNGDGSALFLGFAGDSGFTSVSIVQTSCPCDTADFAIGSLQVTAAPEPGPLTLMLLAAGLFLASRATALLARLRPLRAVEPPNPLESLKGKV